MRNLIYRNIIRTQFDWQIEKLLLLRPYILASIAIDNQDGAVWITYNHRYVCSFDCLRARWYAVSTWYASVSTICKCMIATIFVVGFGCHVRALAINL